MRKYLLAAVAAAAIASPAAARDGAGYIGIEGGVLFPRDSNIDIEVDGDEGYDDAFGIDYKMGYDVDLIGGYDFGAFRLEGELGYKRAKADELEVDPALIDLIEDEIGEEIDPSDLEFDGSNKVSVLSGMVNALADFGNDDGVSGFVGGGFGRARVKAAGESDSAWAWQLLAGVRTAVSNNVDVGLKYRYFRTGKLNYDVAYDFGDEDIAGSLETRFSSHSLLASLIYNFNAPAAPLPVAAPPPPPVEAPATQTCADGTVILATEVCPVPPPPPPPPPAGERG